MARSRVFSFMSGLKTGSSASPTPPPHRQDVFISPSSSMHSMGPSGDSPQPPTARSSRPSSRPMSILQPMQQSLLDLPQETIPELQPIFTFLNSHSKKLYSEGYFLKLNDLNPDGRPSLDRSWVECFAQLVGTVLQLWEASALDAAGQDGEVVPTFINLTDASIKMIPSLPTRSNEGPPLENVLSVSTAGRNRYLLHFNSRHSLTQWTAGIRLAMFEHSSLQEAYTGALIAGKGKQLTGIRSIMEKTRFRYEDWARVRFGAGTPWRKCWTVVSPPDEKLVAKQRKILKKQGKLAGSQHAPMLYGDIKFYDTKKTKKATPIATVTQAYSAFAIYPESRALIDNSTLVKVEGVITFHSSPPSKSEGFVFVMPDIHPAVSGFEMMLRWLFPVYDVFGLYGRPGRLVADTLDPRSLMFAMPKERQHGYLQVSDVADLILNDVGNQSSESDWRRKLKEVAQRRMIGGPGSNGRKSHRASLPAHQKFSSVKFGDEGDLSRQSSGTSSPRAVQGVPFPPPEVPFFKVGNHQRSVSEPQQTISSRQLPRNQPSNPLSGALYTVPSRTSDNSLPEVGEGQLEYHHTSSSGAYDRVRSPTPDGIPILPEISRSSDARPPRPPPHSNLSSASHRMSIGTLAAISAATPLAARPDDQLRPDAGLMPQNKILEPLDAYQAQSYRPLAGPDNRQNRSNPYHGTISGTPRVGELLTAQEESRIEPNVVRQEPERERRFSWEAQNERIGSGSGVQDGNQRKPEQPLHSGYTDHVADDTSYSAVSLPLGSGGSSRVEEKPLPRTYNGPSSRKTPPQSAYLPADHRYNEYQLDPAILAAVGRSTTIDSTRSRLDDDSVYSRQANMVRTMSKDSASEYSSTEDYASTTQGRENDASDRPPRAGVKKTIGNFNTPVDVSAGDTRHRISDSHPSTSASNAYGIDFGPTYNLAYTGHPANEASQGQPNEWRSNRDGQQFIFQQQQPQMRVDEDAARGQPRQQESYTGYESVAQNPVQRRSMAWQAGMVNQIGTPDAKETAAEYVREQAAAAQQQQKSRYVHARKSSSNILQNNRGAPSPTAGRPSSAEQPHRPSSRGGQAAFAPGGMLANSQDLSQHLSAREQEYVARQTGTSLLVGVDTRQSRPPHQVGLLGTIEAREREKKDMSKTWANQAAHASNSSPMVAQAIAQRQAHGQPGKAPSNPRLKPGGNAHLEEYAQRTTPQLYESSRQSGPQDAYQHQGNNFSSGWARVDAEIGNQMSSNTYGSGSGMYQQQAGQFSQGSGYR